MKHVHAEVIKAWADDTSQIVQFRANDLDDWDQTDAPQNLAWKQNWEYRIKPQLKAISWVSVYGSGFTGPSFSERGLCDANATANRIAVIEIRDDGTAHLHKVEA